MDAYHSYYGVEWYFFLLVWGLIALGSHVYQVGFVVKLIRLGKNDDRFNSWKQRTKEFLTDWLGQRKVVEDKLAGYAHALIFWGFLMLVSDVIDLSTGGYFAKILGLIYLGNLWNLIVDIGYLMAGIGILFALYRRLIVRPEKLKDSSLEGVLILFAILGIVITAFIVEAIGGELIEMERSREKSFCCGGGGARIWMEEDADKRVNEIRAKEAVNTGAGCVAVGCPFCMTMMSDGLKTLGEEQKTVKDISEIMLENLEE